MSQERTQGHVTQDQAVIPTRVWVLALVVLILAATACGLWGLYALRTQRPLAGPSPTPIIWTTTPRPTTAPTVVPTETAAPTPTISPEIAIGRYVTVSGTEGTGVSLRQDPDVNSPRLSIGQEGAVFLVIGGPREVGGYTWWLVQDLEDEERQGWSVGNYLEPVEHP